MSRSRKKPLSGTKDTFRTEVCCTGDHSMDMWKREYNRNMRHKNHQHEKELNKLDDTDDDETTFLNKPALTKAGNSWTSPGDGYHDVVASEWYNGKTYQPGMK